MVRDAGDAAKLRTLNRWVILVDEMALDQLDSEAGFSYTTAADHYQFVLS